MSARLRYAVRFAAGLSLFAPGFASSASVASAQPDPLPTIALAHAGIRSDTPSVRWISVSGPGGSTMRAAVVQPEGPGPFPTVIILHGTHGFAHEYVRLARDMARRGVLGVAACWFAGGRGAGTRFIHPIECKDAPPLPDTSDADRFRVAGQSIDALVNAVKSLPDVRSDRVALFGHSRGGGAALNYALMGTGTVAAVVLNSTGYSSEISNRALGIDVPILIMHGTADALADGGSAFTNVERAREFEATLRRAGKRVEAKYYDGAGHNAIFTGPTQYRDAVARVVAFLASF